MNIEKTFNVALVCTYTHRYVIMITYIAAYYILPHINTYIFHLLNVHKTTEVQLYF